MPKTSRTNARATAERETASTAGRAPTKYRQVAAALRELIDSGRLPPGSVLPSEAEMQDRFGVSQPTVRAAVRELREQGVVVTLHGRGSFVRRADERPAHTRTRTVTRDRAGHHADTDLDPAIWRDVEAPGGYRTNATVDLALALGVAEHTPLFVYDRLLADPSGRRSSHRLYLPFPVAVDVPDLADDPFRAPAELYDILARAGYALTFTDYLRARIPTPDDAAALRVTDGMPLLVIRRITTDDTGRILAMEETKLSTEDTHVAYPVRPETIGARTKRR